MAQLFVKRPVVVEAMQVPDTLNQSDELREFVKWMSGVEWSEAVGITGIYIQTLEGVMRANIGDWIVRGIRNEYYPVRRDIFEETYTLAFE